MKKKVKIIIIVVLIVAIVVGCIAGGIYYKNSKGIADVISVSSISTTDDNTSLTSAGMVCDDACQTVYLTEGQKVTDVYVTEGTQVKAGDKLMAYDVTSLSLSVEIKNLEIKSLENQLVTEKQKLEKLKSMKPVSPKPDTSENDNSGNDAAGGVDSQPGSTENHDVISDLSSAVSGSGTNEDPYIFNCTEESYVSGALMNALIEKKAVARFVVGDVTTPDMEFTLRGEKLQGYDDSDEIKLFLNNSATQGQEPVDGSANSSDEQDAGQDNEDTTVEDESRTYTAAELKNAINEQTRSVAEADLQKRSS